MISPNSSVGRLVRVQVVMAAVRSHYVRMRALFCSENSWNLQVLGGNAMDRNSWGSITSLTRAVGLILATWP